MRLYTIETFLYSTVNDVQKNGISYEQIKRLGPYSYALNQILNNGTLNQQDYMTFKDGVTVFRGTCKTLMEIEKFTKNVGHKIPWNDDVYWIRPSKLQTLFGMTSTSKSFDTAWKFAYYDPKKAL